MQPRGSIFRYEFLGEVLFKSDLPGVVIEMGFYFSVHGEQIKVELITLSLLHQNECAFFCKTMNSIEQQEVCI